MRKTEPNEWIIKGRPQAPWEIHEPGFREAICAHSIGHHKGIHGCDGCCNDWPEEISNQVSED